MEIKGPFSYSGNKYKIYKAHLKPIFDEFDQVIEPFAGSAPILYNANGGGIGSDTNKAVVFMHNSLKIDVPYKYAILVLLEFRDLPYKYKLGKASVYRLLKTIDFGIS